MKHKALKLLSFVCVFIGLAIITVLGVNYVSELRKEALYAKQIETIKKASGIANIADFHQMTDHLRTYINTNSRHMIDDEFRSLWRDKTKLAGTFVDYVEGRRKELPKMECATRSALMMAVLNAHGFKTRSIDAYANDKENNILNSHALLDVWNPELQKWETHDPEFDVYWKNIKTGERVSMIESSLDNNIMPCNNKDCGWYIKNSVGNPALDLKKLTEYLTAIDRNTGERITYYHPDISPDKQLQYDGKQGTYCDILRKNCEDGFYMASQENFKKVMD